MSIKRFEKWGRAVAVAMVAIVGLAAATPSVHGTADTRGGAPCDVNKTIWQRCGDTSYGGMCLYTYTTCYSVAGWRFMTCVKKPLANNNCEKDVARCFPRDDYMTTGNCTPNYQAPEAGAAISRISQLQ